MDSGSLPVEQNEVNRNKMEEFSTEDPSEVKQDKKNLLLTSKDPHLSHLFGDDPKTPNSLSSTDVSNQSVMEDSGQFHDEESSEPEYRLFEEQSYVPDLSPSNQVLDAASRNDTENAGPSTSKTFVRRVARGKIPSNDSPRSNGSARIKPFPCKKAGCKKAYSDNRSLQKHIAKMHANDVNNNSVPPAPTAVASKRMLLPTEGTARTESVLSTARQVDFKDLNKNYDTVEYQSASVPTSAHASGTFNGTPVSQPSSDPNVGLLQGSQVESKIEVGATQLHQDSNNHYNMQLLAQSAQHSLRNQPGQINAGAQHSQQTAANFIQHQSSSALQQIAMRVQMRTQDPVISVPPPAVMHGNNPEVQVKQQFMSMPGQITGVRAQLRKSLSSNGKLETANTMPHDWPRMQIPVGGSLDSSMGPNFFHMGGQPENDPANIDNAPLLKNLLAGPKPSRRMSSSENNTLVQENGRLSVNTGYPTQVGNSWPPETVIAQNQENLRSPLLAAKRNVFQYHRTVGDIPELEQQHHNPTPSPLHSPSYVNTQQFPTPQHNQTTPIPQTPEQRFFGNDDIMVNNNNNQQMVQTDDSTNLNEMIIESESLVQDLIDEAEASSNHSHPQQQQLMGYAEGGQITPGRVTPPPAYLDPNASVMNPDVIQNDPSSGQLFMGQKLMVKSEPQSPMIISPVGQRTFFSSQGMGVHPASMQPLSSPTTPCHQVPMQPQTPTGEAQWQFTMSSQPQNYGSVPQSPVGPINVTQLPNQDNLVQTINYLPHARQQGVGNQKPARPRRTSGGAARKNPDGTLSCAICGHSFRSVPALNGHMRVHSSSADKKSKDERQRKTSGSSSGGNESRTPQTLSSPTTPTYNKITPTASMYQNTAAYNSVTIPAYTNSALYNQALSMDAGGSVVPIPQNLNARDAPLVHRINPQTCVPNLYPYTLQHTAPMQPLLAAANLFARSEPDLTPYMRSPLSAHDEYARHTLPQVPELQNIQFLTHQPGKIELPAGYRNTPQGSVILVQPQNSLVPSYLPHHGEHVQASSATTMPFVTLSLAPSGLPVGRQVYAGSPPQEQNTGHAPQLDNIQYLQQPLLQQPSNRSTPLADFADIAVLHDQGQLFTTSSMFISASQSQHAEEAAQRMQQQQSQNQSHSEQLPLPDLSKDFLWPAESQPQTMTKMDRVDTFPPKEADFLPSSMAQIDKNNERVTQRSQTDPFIFPVSVPVHCSRDEATSVTTTIPSYFRQNYSNNMSAFQDDPLMLEAINVANPSTILPNSMMGGNPSGFRSFRQRHHSEGSILKKTWQPELPSKDDLKVLTAEIGLFSSKVSPKVTSVYSSEYSQNLPVVTTGSKRKVESVPPKADNKKLRIEYMPQNPDSKQSTTAVPIPDTTEKKEVWTVPKHAAPARQRHRRHSADSRLAYKPGALFSRQAYLASIQMAGKPVLGRSALNTVEAREKKRPAPLIIPASVNAYTNGSSFISQLHHRRRPSGDSGSSCGNEKIPPYTPPPMLSPLRLGTGLYYNTPGTPSLKPLYKQASFEHSRPIAPIPEEEIEEELVRSADPKINIGTDYQADLPDLCPRWKLERDTHKAELVWKPSPEVQVENSTQSRHVEEYLKLACSAAAPHGGCNKELALHTLHENKGDILASVRQLLHSPTMSVPFDHWMASYAYTGAARWSLKERQMFEHATMTFHKDFYQIAKQVATKKTAQCVDYYYHTIKRRKRRIQRPRRFRADSEEEENIKASFTPSPDGSDSHPSDESDFLRDHIPNRREAAAALEQIAVFQMKKERGQEQKNSEVVRRSPPSTAFIRAPPQVNRVVAGMPQTSSPPALINFAAASHVPQMHSYARQPLNLSTQQRQAVQRAFTNTPNFCNLPNCNKSFSTMQLLIQHQQTHKNLKPYLERLNRASPSPSSSPGSVASVDAADTPQFQCPRCGKTFSKVKSRNAHMKTHGKLAQEKRRQKEEEARRKKEEQAVWRNRTQQQRIMHPSPGNGRDLIQFQATASPLTKPPGM